MYKDKEGHIYMNRFYGNLKEYFSGQDSEYISRRLTHPKPQNPVQKEYYEMQDEIITNILEERKKTKNA